MLVSVPKIALISIPHISYGSSHEICMKLNCGEMRHQVQFSQFREIKSGQDSIVHFIL